MSSHVYVELSENDLQGGKNERKGNLSLRTVGSVPTSDVDGIMPKEAVC